MYRNPQLFITICDNKQTNMLDLVIAQRIV